MVWGTIILLILVVVLTVVAELLRPKPDIENARPAGLGDFDFPTATEGRAIPVVFGTVKIAGPNVVWYGDLLVDPLPGDPGEGGEGFLHRLAEESRASGYIGKLAHNYQNTYLPDYVLCNSDRASMLNSIELRSPLLDPRLGRLANSLPDSIKMSGFTTKLLLKKIARRYLPRDVVYRRKIGFTIPAAKLIRGDLREEIEDLFSEAHLRQQGLFRHEPIRAILDLHFSGREDRYKQIWTLFSLQKWLVENRIC